MDMQLLEYLNLPDQIRDIITLILSCNEIKNIIHNNLGIIIITNGLEINIYTSDLPYEKYDIECIKRVFNIINHLAKVGVDVLCDNTRINVHLSISLPKIYIRYKLNNDDLYCSVRIDMSLESNRTFYLDPIFLKIDIEICDSYSHMTIIHCENISNYRTVLLLPISIFDISFDANPRTEIYSLLPNIRKYYDIISEYIEMEKCGLQGNYISKTFKFNSYKMYIRLDFVRGDLYTNLCESTRYSLSNYKEFILYLIKLINVTYMVDISPMFKKIPTSDGSHIKPAVHK